MFDRERTVLLLALCWFSLARAHEFIDFAHPLTWKLLWGVAPLLLAASAFFRWPLWLDAVLRMGSYLLLAVLVFPAHAVKLLMDPHVSLLNFVALMLQEILDILRSFIRNSLHASAMVLVSAFCVYKSLALARHFRGPSFRRGK